MLRHIKNEEKTEGGPDMIAMKERNEQRHKLTSLSKSINLDGMLSLSFLLEFEKSYEEEYDKKYAKIHKSYKDEYEEIIKITIILN